MAKQATIKEIAQMAGVSAGTVDRILHNRGKVSEASLAAVNKVLAEVGYRSNIHTSAISLKKKFSVTITTPMPGIGEYWGSVRDGISHALDEFSDIDISCTYAYYNQFDIYSCRSAFESILNSTPDAVIIGPTFADETIALCRKLEKRGIPYCFVDATIKECCPMATFATDQHICGYLLGKLLDYATPEQCSIAIFGTQRTGNGRASNSIAREKGFTDYFKDSGSKRKIRKASFSATNPEENQRCVMGFIRENPDIRGIAVMNSRGYIISDILTGNGITDIRVASFDLTTNNIRCLRDGSISFLLCQRPELQGFQSIKAVISMLLYKKDYAESDMIIPIDIIMKENLPYYKTI